MEITLVHKHLSKEANLICDRFKGIFTGEIAIEINPLDVNCSINDGNFSYMDCMSFLGKLYHMNPDKYQLYITDIDIRGSADQNDWRFGGSIGKQAVISTARIKGKDNEIREKLEICESTYNARLIHLAVHEVGHCLLSPEPDHFEEAQIRRCCRTKVDLESHCTHDKCIMYPVFDLTAQVPCGEVWLLGEKRIDNAGLDENIRRRNGRWFCEQCKQKLQNNLRG